MGLSKGQLLFPARCLASDEVDSNRVAEIITLNWYSVILTWKFHNSSAGLSSKEMAKAALPTTGSIQKKKVRWKSVTNFQKKKKKSQVKIC